MFSKIINLKKNSDTFEGKVKFVTYLANITLLLMHLIYLGYYLYNMFIPLVLIDLASILLYLYYSINGIKNSIKFGIQTYILILTHTILATILLGWKPGFYQWLYALVCAFFLPSFSNINSKPVKRPIYMGLFYVLIFYILATLVNGGYVKTIYHISNVENRVLFSINSFLTFMTIMAFTFFYTTREKMSIDILKYKADFDLLTGLRNRNAMNQIIDNRIDNGEKSFPLAILDIDLFKSINDTYGHNVGDIVLRDLASLLKTMEYKDIISSRWGGEEFLILGPTSMSKKEFVDILNSFRELVEKYKFKNNNDNINLTVSIGVSKYTANSLIKKAINDADMNLYKAKNNGRNKVVH
ncbi:MAG: GGDEF domain-containing protein [Bacilli bacterium]|nr:GGDEF domain-containing protein [Bacilli bacterium]